MNSKMFMMIWGVVFLTLLAFTPITGAQSSTPDFATLDAYLESQMQAMNLPGLALGIVQGDQVMHLAGYGLADPSGQPVTPQTPFRLASVSKTITAVAIMQLVEEGKLALDAPAQTYLPWFRLADEQASALVTVRHLLYHTSGVPQIAGNDNFYNGDLSDSALEQNVRLLADISPNRPVGSTYQYANLNYDLLGLLVQTVSGQTYEAYIQDRIFTPLEMAQSFTSQAEALDQGMATGYRRWFGFPLPANLPDDRATRPSSFLISSAEDLTHLLIALLNGGRYGDVTLLASESAAEMLQPLVPIGNTGRASGMGLEVGEVSGVNMAAKTGGTANYNARLVLVPDSGWGLVVLINTFDIGLNNQFDAIANNITAWLVNGEPLSAVQAPVGGGNALMKFALAAVALLLIITSLRTKIVLPPGSPNRQWLLRHIVLPLVLDAILALVLLVAMPRLMNTPLNFLFYFSPDIFWLTVAVATIPLVKDTIKTILTLSRLQADRRSQAGILQSS